MPQKSFTKSELMLYNQSMLNPDARNMSLMEGGSM